MTNAGAYRAAVNDDGTSDGTEDNDVATVLIAGASGLIGRAAARHAVASGVGRVVGLSRRAPTDFDGVESIAVDLLDAEATAAAVASVGPVDAVVYAALSEDPGLFGGWTDDATIERNAAMARHLFDPVTATSPGLRHVTLLHGAKAYGLHHPELGLSGIHMPLKERWPVRPHRNFYFEQERYLHDRRASLGAEWGSRCSARPSSTASLRRST